MDKQNAKLIAGRLAAVNSKEIDLNRNFSHGVGAAKTMIDEGRGAPTVSLTVDNALAAIDKTIVFGSLNNSQFTNAAALLAAVGGDLLVDDGVIFHDGVLGDVTVTSNDADRLVGNVLRYASNSPLRLTKVSLQSSILSTGAPESTNFSASIKSVWASPFRKTTEEFLQLRKFQSNMSNSPQFADVDFIEEGFQAMISAEHFLVVTIKKNTSLTMTFTVGAQDSRPQFAYRAFKAADRVLKPLRG